MSNSVEAIRHRIRRLKELGENSMKLGDMDCSFLLDEYDKLEAESKECISRFLHEERMKQADNDHASIISAKDAEIERINKNLKWLVRHSIFAASISRTKGAEILGVSLIDLDMEITIRAILDTKVTKPVTSAAEKEQEIRNLKAGIHILEQRLEAYKKSNETDAKSVREMAKNIKGLEAKLKKVIEQRNQANKSMYIEFYSDEAASNKALEMAEIQDAQLNKLSGTLNDSPSNENKSEIAKESAEFLLESEKGEL